MLLLWCSMAKIVSCLLTKILFSNVSPQGKKKTTMSHLKKIFPEHFDFDVIEKSK